MTDQEIRRRLERYKVWRRDRSQGKDYTGPGFANFDADWLIDELERQIERNRRLAQALKEVKG